jgi:hypothetical protein
MPSAGCASALRRLLQLLNPRTVLSAAIVARPEAFEGAGSVRDAAKKQNISRLGNDVGGIRVYAVVVELHPLLAVVRAAVSVVVACVSAVWNEMLGKENEGNVLLQTDSPAGVIGNSIQPKPVVLIPEWRVRGKIRRKVNLTKRHIDKCRETVAETFRNSKTLQMHDEDVGCAPNVHLLGGFDIFLAVRAPAEQSVNNQMLQLRHSHARPSTYLH